MNPTPGPPALPRRGDVWLIGFDPTRGHEQAGVRPALVLSVDQFNASAAGLVTVLPITSRARNVPTRIDVQPPEGGLTMPSFIIGEQTRTISVVRLGRRLGSLRPSTMARVETVVRTLLGL